MEDDKQMEANLQRLKQLINEVTNLNELIQLEKYIIEIIKNRC